MPNIGSPPNRPQELTAELITQDASVKQATPFPTQKVWAFLASTGFLTAFFGMLSDYGIDVQPNTQAFITVILVFAAMWATPNKVGE